ncbi:P-loop containing nucleoside triphosphate hydrolase protein [Hyaloraphidium curvatum]|nr:P-loop containing nucleoside triphosphate hydrolase protein [Hyaloraphidium curvatum]
MSSNHPGGPPRVDNCHCGAPPKHLQTRKENANKGRWFFSCATGSCKFFAWDDATPRDQMFSSFNAGQQPGAGPSAGGPPVEPNQPFHDSAGRGRGGFGGMKGSWQGRGGAASGGNPNSSWTPNPGWAEGGGGRGANRGGANSGGNRSWAPNQGAGKYGSASPPKGMAGAKPSCDVVFSVFDADRVGVRMGMSDVLNRWLKDKVPNVRFDGESRLWIFEQHKYLEVLKEMEADKDLENKVSLRIQEIPDFVEMAVKEIRNRMVVNPDERAELAQDLQRKIPAALFATLLPFQRTGVRKAIENGGRVFFCDEMGLGKTIQALTVLSYYKSAWPALIICPSSLRHTWKGEMKRWLKLEDDDIQVISAGKDRIDDRKLMTIISYDLAAKEEIAEELLRLGFACVVADESHNLKSPDSKRTRSITPLLQQARHAILISGTPALSRPIELFPQLACLKPELFKKLDEFGKRYCDPQNSRFKKGATEYRGATNLQELHFILDKTVLVRRLKKDVLKELPEKQRQCIFVEMPASSRKIVDKMMADLLRLEEMKKGMLAGGADPNKIKGIEVQCRSMYTDLYTQTGHAKLPAVTEYLQEVYQKSDTLKIIVFGHHKEATTLFVIELSSQTEYIRIDGATPQRDRQILCDQFQTDPLTRIAILSIKAAGVGLTLNKADYVIFAGPSASDAGTTRILNEPPPPELFWNPGDLLQGEDRAHRIGREGPVAVKYIIASNSLDDRQWPLVRKKLEVVGRSVDGNSKDINIEETDGINLPKGPRQSSNRAAKDQSTITNFFRPGADGGTGAAPDGDEVDEIVDDDFERVMMDLGREEAEPIADPETDSPPVADRSLHQARQRKRGRSACSDEDEDLGARSRPQKRGPAAIGEDFGRQMTGTMSAPADLPLRRKSGAQGTGRPLTTARPPRDPTLSSDSGDEAPDRAPRDFAPRGHMGASSAPEPVLVDRSRGAPSGLEGQSLPAPALAEKPKPAIQAVESNGTANDFGEQDSFFGDDDDFFMEAVAVATQIENRGLM